MNFDKHMERVRKIKQNPKEEFEMKDNYWVPISSGLFPQDLEDVQVTFIGYNDHKPHCEGFAYRNEGAWYWSIDDEEVTVEVTAWKYNCKPYIKEGYDGESTLKWGWKDETQVTRLIKIVRGFYDGTVRLISSPNDGCIACSIGDGWFYFIGCEDENLNPEEVMSLYDIFTVAEMILDAIIDLDDDEYTYYCDMLGF